MTIISFSIVFFISFCHFINRYIFSNGTNGRYPTLFNIESTSPLFHDWLHFHLHLINHHCEIISPIHFECDLSSFRFICHPLYSPCFISCDESLEAIRGNTPTPDKTGALMDSFIDFQFSLTEIKESSLHGLVRPFR